jgi:hypothetical protein
MNQKLLGRNHVFFLNQLKNNKNKLNRYTYKLDFKPDLIIVNVFLIQITCKM